MTIFSKHLDELGGLGGANSTATKNLNFDYSSTDVDAWIEAPSGQELEVHRMIVHIGDSGNFSADGYGSTSDALSSGIQVLIERQGSVIEHLTDYGAITRNSDWSHYAYDVNLDDFGVGANFLKARWTFTRFGSPVILRDSRSDKFMVRLRDDLQFLSEHHFVVQGNRVGTERH